MTYKFDLQYYWNIQLKFSKLSLPYVQEQVREHENLMTASVLPTTLKILVKFHKKSVKYQLNLKGKNI